ncbi:unnamed protein product, partial [Ilex paraguariensis]
MPLVQPSGKGPFPAFSSSPYSTLFLIGILSLWLRCFVEDPLTTTNFPTSAHMEDGKGT